jgi:hypothetical protein
MSGKRSMVSLLLELMDLPTAAELRSSGAFQMQVNLDLADSDPPLATIILRFVGPHAVDNAKRFIEERETMLDEFILTAGSD